MQRREWLKAAGGLFALTGVAGCSDLGGDGGDGTGDGDGTDDSTGTDGEDEMLGGGELPAFGSFVGAPEEAPASEPMTFVSVDIAVYEWLQSDETATPTPTETDSGPEDPLLRNPLTGLIVALFAAGFGTAGTGLQGLAGSEEQDPSEIPTERISVVEGGIVFSGSFETETRVQQVEGAGLTEEETVGEFTLYASSETAVAISADHIVVGSSSEDGTSALEGARGAVQTFRGESDRFADASDDHDWCLRTGGNGDIVVGRTTTDDAMDPQQEGEGGNFQLNNEIYRGAKTVVQSLSGNPEEALDATAALVYPSADDVDTGELEGMIGAEASSSSVTQAEARVVVEASYSPDS